MLISKSPQGNIVERILRDKDGRLVLATFCVYEIDGRIKARLVNAVFLEEAPAIENKVLTLSGFSSKIASTFLDFIQKAIVSPYFNNNLLYFSGSKPRAPTK